MKTLPIDEILPKKIDADLNLILNKLSDTIDEVVNFGTHILKSDVLKKREGKDNVVPSAFLRNILELLDGISILIRSSSIDPSKILLRTFIENALSLLYMIEKDEKQRAHYFLVWSANKDIKYYKKFLIEEESSKQLSTKLTKQDSEFDLTEMANRDEIVAVIKAKKELLNLPIYEEINKEYIRIKKDNPYWYSLFNGPVNFEKLSEYLNKSSLYEFHYRKYSQNVHAVDVMRGFIKSGEDHADLRQIRDFKDCKEVFYNVFDIFIPLLHEFINKRLPEKNYEFSQWLNSFAPIFRETDRQTQFNYME